MSSQNKHLLMFQSTEEKKEPFSKFNWKLKHFLEIFSPVVFHLLDMIFSFVNKAGLKLWGLLWNFPPMRLQIDKEGIKLHKIKLIKLCFVPLLAKSDGTKYSANYAECSSLTLSNTFLRENANWLFWYSLLMLETFIQSGRILCSTKWHTQ